MLLNTRPSSLRYTSDFLICQAGTRTGSDLCVGCSTPFPGWSHSRHSHKSRCVCLALCHRSLSSQKPLSEQQNSRAAEQASVRASSKRSCLRPERERVPISKQQPFDKARSVLSAAGCPDQLSDLHYKETRTRQVTPRSLLARDGKIGLADTVTVFQGPTDPLQRLT